MRRVFILKQNNNAMEDNKVTPTEYDMLVDDEQTILNEMEDYKSNLIDLENELQIVRDKLAFIKRAVPENIQMSIND
jgi:hypothetical protein